MHALSVRHTICISVCDHIQKVSSVSDDPVVPPEDPAMVELKAENERLKAHHAKLLDETKTAKQRAAELDKASQDAEIARQHEQGEYKTLAERYKAEADAERKANIELKGGIANEKLDGVSMQAALAEANSPANAKILVRFIRDQLEYTDAGVIGKGGKSVDDAVKELFATGDFEALRKGNQSNGGSAPGSVKASGAGEKSNPKADEARKKGDLSGFLAASLTQ